MERLFVEVFSQADAEGKVYWTARFLNRAENVIGGGTTPEEAITELFDNWKVWQEYETEEKKNN